ncbi:hypothetical protein QVD17_39710 [Tagetes erecta]|uniref:Uncharacterized protein n=1 Tax=Tagetes erecta TaxID=13708 RepID=A0AAD8NHF6_TARER|nr:hypothetical protein QVD17_39710 [Tagetes erecta]
MLLSFEAVAVPPTPFAHRPRLLNHRRRTHNLGQQPPPPRNARGDGGTVRMRDGGGGKPWRSKRSDEDLTMEVLKMDRSEVLL